MHAAAVPPQRSISSTTLMFGLVNVPVSIYTAVEETRVQRKEFTADGHSVGRQMYDKVTGEVVEYRDVIKMVEVADETFVALSDDEIARATGHSSGATPIVGKVSIDDVPNFTVEQTYQIRPKRDKKSQQPNDRAFGLLTEALGRAGQAAVVKIALRGAVAKWALVMPDGRLLVLRSIDQVRKPMPMPAEAITEQELAVAASLLDTISTVDPASMIDESSRLVMEYATSKISGEDMPVDEQPTPNIAGLMDLLSQSIDEAKKQRAA